jgi:hypothetical protein
VSVIAQLDNINVKKNNSGSAVNENNIRIPSLRQSHIISPNKRLAVFFLKNLFSQNEKTGTGYVFAM